MKKSKARNILTLLTDTDPSLFCREDCTYFELEPPDFSLAEETKQDMEECSQMWGLYEEWQQGFTEKAQEDWISFRSD